MRYAIAHEVSLRFAAPVWEHHCEIRLLPAPTAQQTPGAVAVDVEPAAEVRGYRDGYGNPVQSFTIVAPHAGLRIRVRAEVETTLGNPFDFPLVAPARQRQWIAETLRAQPRLWDYLLHRSPCTPAAAVLAAHGIDPPALDPEQPLLDAVQVALDWMDGAIEHVPCFATPPLPLAEALAGRAGGCQDFAHLLVSVVRGWGFPARYAMGYRDPEYAADEAQRLHAWAEVLVPGAGWRGVDPTAHLVANDTYVTVAVGRDAADVPPLKAHWKGGDEPGDSALTLEVVRDQ